MHRQLAKIRLCSIAIALLALVAVSGCESTSNWLKGRKTADAEEIAVDAPDANPYLVEIQALASGDPATQAEIYADSQSAATLTPDASTKLRFALVLATTGHPGTDAVKAEAMLRDVLSQTEMMTVTEVALATIFLNDVEKRIVLESETQRLRASTTRAATSEEAAIARRISTVEAENRQLRESLADAEAKIEALSSIERSIRAQSENGDPQ